MKRQLKTLALFGLLSVLMWQCKPKDNVGIFDDYFNAAYDLAKVSDIEDENWKYIEGPYIDNDYIERSLNSACPETFWSGDTLIVQYGDTTYCTAPGGRKHWGQVLAWHNGNAGVGLQINLKSADPPRGSSDSEPFAMVEFMRSTLTSTGRDLNNDGHMVNLFTWDKQTSIRTGERETVIDQDITMEVIQKPSGRFYKYTGQGSGRSGNLEFDFNIIEALESSAATEIVKGKMRVRFHGGETIIIDWGGGETDKTVEISVEGGEKRTIDLNEGLIKYVQ